MKYLVEVEYTIRRSLTVHAANPELAKAKAAAIVQTWAGSINPQPLSVTEVKGETL